MTGPNHGYGIQHFLEIAPNFGTESDLIELVDEAHEAGRRRRNPELVRALANPFDTAALSASRS